MHTRTMPSHSLVTVSSNLFRDRIIQNRFVLITQEQLILSVWFSWQHLLIKIAYSRQSDRENMKKCTIKSIILRSQKSLLANPHYCYKVSGASATLIHPFLLKSVSTRHILCLKPNWSAEHVCNSRYKTLFPRLQDRVCGHGIGIMIVMNCTILNVSCRAGQIMTR